MPISSTKDILDFVNKLEADLNKVTTNMASWQQNKGDILTAVPLVAPTRTNSITALVRAEEALAELNTATFGVAANKGQRLKRLLEDLKLQMIAIAENSTGSGVDPYLKAEINNAIADVNPLIDDGLKLDYRIRSIQEMAKTGERDIVMPYRVNIDHILSETTFLLPKEEGVVFVEGQVTVLRADGEQGILASNNNMITGTINADGQVQLDEAPMQPVRLYFPVKLKFKDVPDDFMYYMQETVLSKASPMMETMLRFEDMLTNIIVDVESMKGADWTVDFNIMGNQKQIVLESITPKGLSVAVQDGIVHATFSYNDHPNLSHFVLEKWDEEANDWQPYDGAYGVVAK